MEGWLWTFTENVTWRSLKDWHSGRLSAKKMAASVIDHLRLSGIVHDFPTFQLFTLSRNEALEWMCSSWEHSYHFSTAACNFRFSLQFRYTDCWEPVWGCGTFSNIWTEFNGLGDQRVTIRTIGNPWHVHCIHKMYALFGIFPRFHKRWSLSVLLLHILLFYTLQCSSWHPLVSCWPRLFTSNLPCPLFQARPACCNEKLGKCIHISAWSTVHIPLCCRRRWALVSNQAVMTRFQPHPIVCYDFNRVVFIASNRPCCMYL